MNINFKNIVVIICVILLSITLYHFIFNKKEVSEHKIVHIDNAKVFSEFSFSKDISKIGLEKITPQKRIVDSIYNLLQTKDGKQKTNSIQKEFIAQNEKLSQLGEEINNQTNFQIWSRINQYVTEYGKLNNYELILGATGNGNIMYAENSIDITDDFIIYANSKYEKGE